MNFLVFIVFGAIAGYIASRIMKGSNGLVEDIILGIVGAFLGGFIMTSIGQAGVTGFNIYSFVVAILGAIILIFLARQFRHRRKR
jgi:uncharacterized membrane protein YeaQ/YmgE (transglycosylase-associated protein family)